MGLSDIDAAVRAYRKLTDDEKKVFKTETRKKVRRKRKKRATARAATPVKAVRKPRKKKVAKKKVARRPATSRAAVPAPHPDPLRDIKDETGAAAAG